MKQTKITFPNLKISCNQRRFSPFVFAILFMFISSIGFSQEYECSTSDFGYTPTNGLLGGGGCFNFLYGLPTDGCKNFEHFAPIDPRFTPIKNVKFILHVVQQDDGSDNFQDTQAHRDIIDGIINGVNYRFGSNFDVDTPVPACPSTFIEDTRIRIVREGDIIFHQDSDMWDAGDFQEGCTIYDELVLGDPSLPNDVIHVFFVGAELLSNGTLNQTQGGYAAGIPVNNEKYLVLKGYFHQGIVLGNSQNFSGSTPNNLQHEFCHAFGLFHTQRSSGDFCCDTAPGAIATNNNLMNTGIRALSECQIARMHYFLDGNCALSSTTPSLCTDVHETNCTDYCSKDIDGTIIVENGENITLEVERRLNSDIIIESGGRLTIKCRVEMANNTRIFVKEGGRLNVYGGHLTNACDKMWGGIEAWGDPDLPFSQSTHAFVHIKSGAIIEHALDGVLTYNSGILDGTGEIKDQGGIVIATGSSFINNQRSADFYNYTFDTASEFYDCEFTVNDDYRRNTNIVKDYFDAHITMTMANGLLIRESRFSNDYSIPVYISKAAKLGEGIRTSDGGFEVQSSSFSGFEHGIYAANTCNLETFNVHNGCNFQKNQFGVRVDGVNNFRLVESSFEIGEANVLGAPDVPFQQYGLVNFYGSGFSVEGNSFAGTTEPFYSTTYGIWMDNTNEIIAEPNLIYRNTFSNMEFANFATGINKIDEGFEEGLEFNCNYNIDNLNYDFAVVGKGVSKFQGAFDGSKSAGNSFTNTQNSNFFHFFNGGEDITYMLSSIDPPASSLNLTTNTINALSGATQHQCESTFLDSPQGPNDDVFRKNNSSYEALKAALDQMIDGGNSVELINQISETSSNKAIELKNNLLQFSPYLSNEAIKAFADRTDIFSNEDIYEVIVRNPEEARKLGSFLIEKEVPFTDFMMTELATATTDLSVRGEKEAELSFYYTQMITAANNILFDLKMNNPNQNLAKVNQWITNKNNPLPFYGLIELQVREGNFAAAQIMINDVSLNYDLSPVQQLEYENFVLLKSHQMEVYGNGETWGDLSTEQEEDLVAIADYEEGWTGNQARHILNHFFGYHYPLTPPAIEEDESTPVSPFVSTPDNPLSQTKSIVASPNPASENVFFDFKDLDYKLNNRLYIKDLSGNLIQTFTLEGESGNVEWSTYDAQSGIYFYYIEVDGFAKAVQKLILIK